MRLIFTFILILSFSYSYAVEKHTFSLSEFDKLVVIGNFSAQVIQSTDKREVLVEVMDEEVEIDKLSFTYENGELVVRYKGSFVQDIDIYLTFFYPQPIYEITARRGAEIKVEEPQNLDKKAKYRVENGGKLLVKDVKSSQIITEISKGGSIRLTGETDYLDASISMGGTIGVVQLKTKEVKAKVNMGGEIICAPIVSLNAKVVSGGTINYKGDPKKIKQKVSLGGTIEKL